MAIRVAKGRLTRGWKQHHKWPCILIPPDPVVAPGSRFFLMGSCFAMEIRRALTAQLGQAAVGPDYTGVSFDPERVQIDQLPLADHLNTYNVHSVLQEIEGALGLWKPASDHFWQVARGVQCPYRRLVIAETPDLLADARREVDAAVARGFDQADHFIFTFGMTEIFENRASGRIANQKPGYRGGGGHDETTFRRASYDETRAALDRIVALIGAEKPEARIFVTVSPVPLARTFSDDHVYVANAGSKALLRTALGEMADRHDAVTYFPSYEAVMHEADAAFTEDGRHVRRDLVDQITDAFCRAYLQPSTAASRVA